MSRAVKTSNWVVYDLSDNDSPTDSPPLPRPPYYSGSCDPHYLNLASNDIIRNGDSFVNGQSYLVLEQKDDGNLIVRRGSTFLWASGVRRSEGEYYTKLQGDGNMVTYKGSPSDRGERVWKSGESGSTSDGYYFGLSCDGDHVAIYSSSGDVLWSDRTFQ